MAARRYTMSNEINGRGIQELTHELFERVLKENKPELDRIATRAEPTMEKDECRQQAVFKVFRWFPKLLEKLLSDDKPEDQVSKILYWALVKTMKRLIVDELRRAARHQTISLETGGSDDDGDANVEGAALVQRAKEVFRA